MTDKPKRTSNIKYSILKPTAQINSLRRGFIRPHPRCSYELAQANQTSIRRYKKNIESLQQILLDCQWRHEQKAPIIRCLYVELLAPILTSKSISVEIYVEDLEVSLAKMKKILLPQALYLIVRAIEGYKALWERFKHVSIDEETFGLDCKGNCVTWINSSLQKNHCEDFKLSTPEDMVREIILQVKSRSQPVCEALLSKLLDNLSRRELDFNESQQQVSVFMKNHQITMPENLKYLVHQNRLNKNIEEFKINRSLYQTKQNSYVKTPRFFPSRTSLHDDHNRKKNINQGSVCDLTARLRMTVGPDARLFTRRSINQDPSINCSLRQDTNSFSQIETRRKFHDPVADKDRSCSSYHSRCKSQQIEHPNGHKNRKIKRQTQTTRSIEQQLKPIKRFSVISDHSKVGGSYIDKFKKSDHSLAELQTAKKLIHKSSNQLDSDKVMECKISCEVMDSSDINPPRLTDDQPTIQRIPINIITPLQSLDPTFHIIPAPEDVIKANQWKTTIRNLLDTQSRLNSSITEGQDTSTYLQDVRLDRLDNISRQMVVSLIPEGSQKLIGSDEIITQ